MSLRPQRTKKAPSRFEGYQIGHVEIPDGFVEPKDPAAKPVKKENKAPKKCKRSKPAPQYLPEPEPEQYQEPEEEQAFEPKSDEDDHDFEPEIKVKGRKGRGKQQAPKEPSIMRPQTTAPLSALPNELLGMIMIEITEPRCVLNLSISTKVFYQFSQSSDIFSKWSAKHLNRRQINNNATARQIVVDALGKTCNSCRRYSPNGLLLHRVNHELLCFACYGSNDYSLMTVTRAKGEFRLNEKDIAEAGLVCLHRRNPHYRSAAPMRLYVVKDLLRCSEAKWAAKGMTLADAKAKSERTKEKRRRKKAGLPLYSDSEYDSDY